MWQFRNMMTHSNRHTFWKHRQGITWLGFSWLQHTAVPSRGISEYSVSSFLWCILFFLLLLCLQYSYSIMFLNLNLFSRSSIQLSNVIVLRIYSQIIVFQALFFSASSFASAFCNLKLIFLSCHKNCITQCNPLTLSKTSFAWQMKCMFPDALIFYIIEQNEMRLHQIRSNRIE